MTVALALAVCGCEQDRLVHITGNTMGTTYSVKVAGEDANNVDKDALTDAIEARLAHINDLMSTWLPDSEISRFNRAPENTWFDVSPEMIEILSLSAQIHEASGGGFDVTVGPLVNLWGFGPEPTDRTVPSDAEIAAAKARVGFDHLEIGEGAIRKTAPLYLDLSAIAKGYGVDVLATLLESHGVANYLVEIGGELRGAGINDRGSPWRIAIERPHLGGRVPFRTLAIRDMALATSGDYRNFYMVDGERYSHTIDPVTGAPITHDLASVTVLAPTCAEADGVATAINVIGGEAGLALAERQGLPVFVIMKGESGFREAYSSAFEAYLSSDLSSDRS